MASGGESDATAAEAPSEAPLREIRVGPPSGRREAITVARALFLIAFWSVVIVRMQAAARQEGGEQAQADPTFVARFPTMQPSTQRAYRALEEGLTEAERARGRTGKWPSAAELANDAIPPFAADPLDHAKYTWRSTTRGRVTNYIGEPADLANEKTFIAIIVEPDPALAVDPNAKADEVHHRIGDAMVHVSTFMGSGAAPSEAIEGVNFNEGWQQILLGSADVIGR